MSHFVSRLVTFSIYKTSKNISNPRIFAGGGARGGPRSRAEPVTHFQITDRSPTQPMMFQSPEPSVRPGRRDSNLTGRLPGLAQILRMFCFALRLRCASSSSRVRGRNVLVSPRPAVALGSRLPSTTGVRTRVSYMPLYTGLRVPLGCVGYTAMP